MLDLWWTKDHWDKILSENLNFCPVIVSPPVLYAHSFMSLML